MTYGYVCKYGIHLISGLAAGRSTLPIVTSL